MKTVGFNSELTILYYINDGFFLKDGETVDADGNRQDIQDMVKPAVQK